MHRFLDVAGAGMGRVNTGINVWIVIIVELASLEEEAGEAVTLEWCVAIM
jgi:hypothetical protein